MFFPGAVNDEAYWDNNDAMFLGRVAEASVDDAAAYEYYAGLDGSGAATWTSDTSQAQPSLYFGRMVGENAVFFNPFLGAGGRYVIANFGLIDEEGDPRPWHSKPFMMPHRTQVREEWRRAATSLCIRPAAIAAAAHDVRGAAALGPLEPVLPRR